MLYITKVKFRIPVTTDSDKLAFPKAWELFDYLCPAIRPENRAEVGQDDGSIPLYFQVWNNGVFASKESVGDYMSCWNGSDGSTPELIPDFSMQQDWYDEQTNILQQKRKFRKNHPKGLRDVKITQPDAIFAAANQIRRKLGGILMVCSCTKQELETDSFLRAHLLDSSGNPNILEEYKKHERISEKYYFGIPTKPLFETNDVDTFLLWCRWDITRSHESDNRTVEDYNRAKEDYEYMWEKVNPFTRLPHIADNYLIPLAEEDREYYFKTYVNIWDTDDKDPDALFGEKALGAFIKAYPDCYLRPYLIHTEKQKTARARREEKEKQERLAEAEKLVPKENEDAEKYLNRTSKKGKSRNRFSFEKIVRFILIDCENQAEMYDFFDEGINQNRLEKAMALKEQGGDGPDYIGSFSTKDVKTGQTELVNPFCIIYDAEDKSWQVAVKDVNEGTVHPIIYSEGSYFFVDNKNRKMEVLTNAI